MTWIGLSGEIGAGKTAVGRTLAQQTKAPYASFGDYVRTEAHRRGLGHRRETLQNLGSELVSSLGAGAFTRRVVEAAGALNAETAVIEGVRHVAVDDALRVLAGERGYLLVYLDTPEPVRKARLAERGEPPQELPDFEDHPTENDVHGALRSRADLVISGAAIKDAVAALRAKLSA